MDKPLPNWEDALRKAFQDHTRDRPDADRTSRLAASLADLLLFTLIASAAHKLTSAAEISLLTAQPDEHSLMLRVAILVGLAAAYFGIATHLLGGTLGKILLGLRVVHHDGTELGFTESCVREIILKYGLGAASAGIVSLLYLTGLRERPLHDQWLRTTVKRVRGRP